MRADLVAGVAGLGVLSFLVSAMALRVVWITLDVPRVEFDIGLTFVNVACGVGRVCG